METFISAALALEHEGKESVAFFLCCPPFFFFLFFFWFVFFFESLKYISAHLPVFRNYQYLLVRCSVSQCYTIWNDISGIKTKTVCLFLDFQVDAS